MTMTRRNYLKMMAGAAALLGFSGRGLAALLQEEFKVAPMKSFTQAELRALRMSAGIAGMGAAHSGNGASPALIADGLRSIDAKAPVTAGDLWHIGSNTKSMTSTLAARLIEKGKIGWDTTVGEIFGSAAPKMQESYKSANFRHLLSHHAGFVPGMIEGMPAANYEDKGKIDTRADHRQLALMAVEQIPVAALGEKMVYSNVGYVTAAAMLEEVYGDSWENLIRAHLFDPLGLRTPGFGPPGTPGKLDQPLGHALPEGATQPIPATLGNPAKPADLPVVLGPAGLVHMSMTDFITYLNAHLQQSEAFLKPDSWKILHTAPFTSSYAMGWVVRDDGSIWHNGSNGRWYGEGAVDFKRRRVACAMSNSGDLDKARVAIGELLRTALDNVA
ncbi:serine hydrolase domain-containing protein [Sphingosinicella rhizophila]|uniref:Serine hydrolase domain-containing protein n=1 Tax=Sphingosinicella rhizophila TaxID=3050082 RepID=A0ABU3Q9D5_9SPHN|nr:serine hydrolase domain-containing protein [Sphingosinicella sp. GR2756]MDT9600021.1 serine hydrolase domain-containing protein [Sphingosinicella sp. GR2756]